MYILLICIDIFTYILIFFSITTGYNEHFFCFLAIWIYFLINLLLVLDPLNNLFWLVLALLAFHCFPLKRHREEMRTKSFKQEPRRHFNRGQ